MTGTRAEFGLLQPVMQAVARHKRLRLVVVAAGAHFLKPARTIREVEAEFEVAARVRMQEDGITGRAADARALGRGVEGFARALARIKPDWVVVLGDRIEAMAAASAASIGGWALAHIHGGDRAEGIADEAMRHAITKLAHLHLAATETSAKRIVRMGETKERVRVVGSPAIDGLSKVRRMSDREAKRLGDPRVVILMHPSGLEAREERAWALAALLLGVVIRTLSFDERSPDLSGVLILQPNSDAGRDEIVKVWDEARGQSAIVRDHLPRSEFVGLLRRLSQGRGVLIGNSSAGLIEASALGVCVVNLGPRQAGRERAGNVVDMLERTDKAVARTIGEVVARLMVGDRRMTRSHPFGDGRAGERIARVLAEVDPRAAGFLRKRNAY